MSEKKGNCQYVDIEQQATRIAKGIYCCGKEATKKGFNILDKLPKSVRKSIVIGLAALGGYAANNAEAYTTLERTNDGKTSNVVHVEGIGLTVAALGAAAVASMSKKERTYIWSLLKGNGKE